MQARHLGGENAVIFEEMKRGVRLKNKRLRTWVWSVLVVIGWMIPVALTAGIFVFATPVDPYWPILLVAGIFGLPLLVATRFIRSLGLWFVSGALFGVVLLSPWIPLTERHLFFVRAIKVHPGMRMEEVRHIMRDYSEEVGDAESDTTFWYWDSRRPGSEMDCLDIQVVNDQVVGTFIGSE